MPDEQPHDEYHKILEEDQGRQGLSHNVSRAAQDLEARLQEEKDARKEERFLFVVAGLVLINVHMLANTSVWTTPVLIGLLQLFGLIVYARRSGIEEVQQWLDKILSAVRRQ